MNLRLALGIFVAFIGFLVLVEMRTRNSVFTAGAVFTAGTGTIIKGPAEFLRSDGSVAFDLASGEVTFGRQVTIK